MYGSTTSTIHTYSTYDQGTATAFNWSVTPTYFSDNTAVNWDTEPAPNPRNRREKRIETSIGDGLGKAWVRLCALLEKEGLYKRDKLNHEFWQWVSFNVPPIPKIKLQKLDMPDIHPDGRSKRLRLCGPRWYPVRS